MPMMEGPIYSRLGFLVFVVLNMYTEIPATLQWMDKNFNKDTHTSDYGTYIQCCHLTSVVWLQTVSNTLRSLQGLWNYFFLVHTVFLQKYIISLYFWPVKHCKWIIYSLNPLKQLPNPLPIYQKHFLNMKK